MEPEQSNTYRREGRPLDRSIYYQQPELQVESRAQRQQIRPTQPRKPHKPQQENDFFSLFDCCYNVPAQPEFNNEVHVQTLDPPSQVRRSQYRSPKTDEPYMSSVRLRSQMNQPTHIYNDHLVSQKLSQSRWRCS